MSTHRIRGHLGFCAILFGTSLLVGLPSLSAAGPAPIQERATKQEKNKPDETKQEKEKPQANSLATIAAKSPALKTFVKAAKAAGMVETFKEKGPFTVLAPTDQAFATLKKGKLEELLKPENRKELRAILSHHIVKGSFKSTDLVGKKKVTFKTLDGNEITARIDEDGTIRIGKARVTKTDIIAANGIIHLIDKVLPPDKPKN